MKNWKTKEKYHYAITSANYLRNNCKQTQKTF